MGAGILAAVIFTPQIGFLGFKFREIPAPVPLTQTTPPLKQPENNQQPSPSPSGTTSQSPTDQESIDKLKSQLYQQGITVAVTVDRVFPGIGFSIVDEVGTKLFVHWKQTAPVTGQNVSVKGTIQRVAGQKEQLKKESGFTASLDQFLSGQTIFIEGQEVTPR